jgi:hypothetical protein
MPAELDHIALANRNHEALRILLAADPPQPEWVATVAFYKALQIIEACFANLGIGHSSGHHGRLDVMARDSRFDPIFKHYKALLEASEIARYLGSRFQTPGLYSTFDDYMTIDDVKKSLLGKRLANVEMHSRAFLSDAAKTSALSQPDFGIGRCL